MNKVIILGSELPRLNAVFPPDLEASPRQSMARAIFAVCLLWIFLAIGRFTSSKCLNKFSLLILLMAKAVARAIPKFCMFNRVIFPGIHWGGKYSYRFDEECSWRG